MIVDPLVDAALMADRWALRRYPRLRPGDVLGLAWEAASRAPAQHARRAAVFGVRSALATETAPRRSSASLGGPRRPREEWAGSEASRQRLIHGPQAVHREPDHHDRLAWILRRANLTPRQADALVGWAHGRSLASEAMRLGVSKDRVSQLRRRAMDLVGAL